MAQTATPLRARLVRQFHKPEGVLGHVAGWIMSHRDSNIERSLWSVDLLDVAPADRVLELGFGPGVAIRALSDRVDGGPVVGVDHSAIMLRHAAKRNADALRAGRVQLHLASMQALPVFGQPFDKILGVNVCMFWAEPASVLHTLYGLLAPGGTIALTVQPRSQGATDNTTREWGERVSGWLHEAGFRDVRREFRPLPPVAAVCVLARR